MAAVKNGREYLAHVTGTLRHRITQLDDSIEAGQKEIEGMHEYYWENYTEMDQYGYENFDNQQALLHEINASNEKIELRRRFRKMMDSPFFGRVDFCYEGDDEPEIFYIGIANLAEENGGLPLIYDWRAPVSGLFYDFDKGPASYQAPLGEIHGDIAAKWQYKIRGGKMIYEFESDVKIDDEILKAELGSNGDVQLKNIIRTIQKEQNAIIRNTSDRIMVIQGAAGSGKTSIALHRIAYLLYHDRKNLKSSSVLVLSPNGVFSDYISHILPELAEMCTEVGIINQGKLAAQGTVQEIMRQLTQKRIIYVRPLAELSKTVEILREMPAVKEITENTADLEFVFDGSEEMLAEILKHLVESGIGIVSFREKEGNLEEIFMQVTGGAGV